MTDAPAYGQVLGRNISAARGRLQLPQSALAERMRALGFPWKQQTVAVVEKGNRRATAEEVLGLALALETTIARLMGASEENDNVLLPNGQPIGAISIERLAGRGVNDGAVRWAGNEIAMLTGFGRRPGVDPFDRELLSRSRWTAVPPMMSRAHGTAVPVVESHDDHGTGPERPGDVL